MTNLVRHVQSIMRRGVYDPEVIFKIMYPQHPVHYSKIREAIHLAKQI